VRTVSRFNDFLVWYQYRGLGKRFRKVSYEYKSSVERTSYNTTLTTNDALPDSNFCNQCTPWKLITSDVFLKHSHNSWMPENAFCPKYTWSFMRQRHKTP